MIPQFEEIRLQALRELSSGAVMRTKELRDPLAKYFQLTEDEIIHQVMVISFWIVSVGR